MNRLFLISMGVLLTGAVLNGIVIYSNANHMPTNYPYQSNGIKFPYLADRFPIGNLAYSFGDFFIIAGSIGTLGTSIKSHGRLI